MSGCLDVLALRGIFSKNGCMFFWAILCLYWIVTVERDRKGGEESKGMTCSTGPASRDSYWGLTAQSTLGPCGTRPNHSAKACKKSC